MDPKTGTRHGNPANSAADNNLDLNAMLDDMVMAGMAVTNSFKSMWHTAIQYAWGRHFEGWELKKEWDYVVINRIYPLLFQSIAKLAGNNPKILAHAWDESKEGASEYAEKWAGHLDYLWKSPYELNMRLKLIMGLLDCGVFGYMVGEPYWENEPDNGWDDDSMSWVGKCDYRFHHPAMFWADPSAESIEKAENCGIKRRVKLEYAQNKWPKFKNEIEDNSFTSNDDEYIAGEALSFKNQKADSVSDGKRITFSKIVDIITNSMGGSSGEGSSSQHTGEQRYVWVEKIFWRDRSKKDIKLEDNISANVLIKQGVMVQEPTTGFLLDPATGQPVEADAWPKQVTAEYKRPKFPKGRFVVRVGRTILNPNEEDQAYKESRWPFIVMPYHILPHMWQGGNAIEMSRNNNDMLNMTVSAMVQQVRRVADPTKVAEVGAMARDRNGKIRDQKDGITKLGRLVLVAKGKIDKIRDWVHPPLDPAVANLAMVLKQDIDDQMFMQDIARGAESGPQKTKAEALQLNQNSLDYVGLQAIYLDKFIDDSMTLVAEQCQHNYEPQRLMKMLQDGQKQATPIDQPLLDVEFDVNIEPGSTLPFDERKKQEEYAMAYKLLENPIPNPMIEDMLRVLNISKRKEILSKYQGLQIFREFVQMGQMLQQAMQDPEGGGKVQAIMQKISGIPEMQKLIELLMQAGQLAPQMKVA